MVKSRRLRGQRDVGLALRGSLNELKEVFMTELQNLTDRVNQLAASNNGLAAKIEESNGKVDALIVAATAAKSALVAMRDSGGATPEQLATLVAQLDRVLVVNASSMDSLAQQEAETDAAKAAVTP